VIRRGVVPEMNTLKPDQIQFSLLRAINTLNYGESITLMFILIIFSACPELSDDGRTLIENECRKYTTSLLRYLQNKHGIQVGTKRFGESMSFIAMLCQKVQNNYEYYAFKRCVLNLPAPSRLFDEILAKRICSRDPF
jgi:hypothetical protein